MAKLGIDITQDLQLLENKIKQAKFEYNQYFMGIEKIEPTVPRKNLDRKIRALRRERMRSTALSFRMQMQVQRYNTQCTYWNRVCRQIENGTYTRHVMLARRRSDASSGRIFIGIRVFTLYCRKGDHHAREATEGVSRQAPG